MCVFYSFTLKSWICPLCPSRIRTVISIAYLTVAKAMQALNGQYEASFDGKAPKACVERLHFGQWGEDRPRPCWLCSFLKHCVVVELLFLVARFLGMIVLEAIRIITYIHAYDSYVIVFYLLLIEADVSILCEFVFFGFETRQDNSERYCLQDT